MFFRSFSILVLLVKFWQKYQNDFLIPYLINIDMFFYCFDLTKAPNFSNVALSKNKLYQNLGWIKNSQKSAEQKEKTSMILRRHLMPALCPQLCTTHTFGSVPQEVKFNAQPKLLIVYP